MNAIQEAKADIMMDIASALTISASKDLVPVPGVDGVHVYQVTISLNLNGKVISKTKVILPEAVKDSIAKEPTSCPKCLKAKGILFSKSIRSDRKLEKLEMLFAKK